MMIAQIYIFRRNMAYPRSPKFLYWVEDGSRLLPNSHFVIHPHRYTISSQTNPEISKLPSILSLDHASLVTDFSAIRIKRPNFEASENNKGYQLADNYFGFRLRYCYQIRS